MQIQIQGEDAKEIRSRANELLLREEWEESIALYTRFIEACEAQKLCNNPKVRRSLCIALSNRAEGRIRLHNLDNALEDVNKALEFEPSHPKSLYCKGKILLELDQYSQASQSFQRALEHQPNTPEFQEALERSRRFESQCKTGAYDLSQWVSGGLASRAPECADYVGPVEVRTSDVGFGERGLFVTKDVEAGALLVVTKPVAIARAILPETCPENARLVMWKEFVTEVERVSKRSSKILKRVYTLVENDDGGRKKELGVPDMGLFRPNMGYEAQPSCDHGGLGVDMTRVLGIADLNTLTEKGCGVKRLGADLYCSSDNNSIGLWVLPGFVNHSCSPNSTRLHVGDAMFLHASKDLKAGDEISFAYFDVLLPLGMRRELCKTWSFVCKCHRCELEQSLEEHLKGIGVEFERIWNKEGGETDLTKVAVKLEEKLGQLKLKAKDRQLIRASFAAAYWPMFRSSMLLKRWGRQMPSIETVIDAVTSALPCDETALCGAAAVVDKLKGKRGLSPFQEAMARALRICKALYGKQIKSHVMKVLIDAHVSNGGIILPKY